MDMDSLKRELFESAMKGEWRAVLNLYRQKPTAHGVKITRAGDTALHIAVSDVQESVVEKLVMIISSAGSPSAALRMETERGNTPLHIAACLGSLRMCYCIAGADPSLVGARNRDGETPLFMAALAGKKEAFLCLHSFCGPEGYLHGRRTDGETILHCAIAGDHFDLAFQIIHVYERFVNYVNEQGLSPLHILASKPNAFRSGSHLGRWNQLVYHCTFVDLLKVDPPFDLPHLISKLDETKCHSHNFPENYATCLHLFVMLKQLAGIGSNASHHSPSQGEGLGKNIQHVNSNYVCQDLHSAGAHQVLPPTYNTCFDFIKFVSKALLVILGLGSRKIRKVREKKEKHTWSVQVMNELLIRTSMYEYVYDGILPPFPNDEPETVPFRVVEGGAVTFSTDLIAGDKSPTYNIHRVRKKEKHKHEKHGDRSRDIVRLKETPVLVAAKCGITEMVEKILERFPVAVHDENAEKKNIVLLAVENRQPHVYQLLLKNSIVKESEFRAVDINGNSALHLAAMLGDHKPWLIPGAALQMQWEIKWYEFVKNSMPLHFFKRYNNDGKTPRDVFTETHKDLVEKGGGWLTNTSESCSVVAALIATVAFATSTALPGGVNEISGKPVLENHPAFQVFAFSSLVALCFSVTSVIMFLAILTSRYQERDFWKDLPRKLLLGLSALFVSIAAILVSFCAGHFFVLRDKLKYAAYPVYAVSCLPVTIFAAAQFPLYFDLVWATFKKVPKRSYRAIPL